MKKWLVFFLAVLSISYLVLLAPFCTYMNNRPVAVRLGYMPHATVLKLAFADYKQLIAQDAVVRVLFYFGSLVDTTKRTVKTTPEYFHMFETLQHAVRLDPYNMDAYYFAQAAFTWELRKIREVNDLLEYGIAYRTWDAQLPFYVGFNYAYFLKDYAAASRFLQRAAELSGNPLYTNLTARYFFEAGQTRVGLAFIEQMEKNTLDPRIKRMYQMRREALHNVDLIEQAVQHYQQQYHAPPRSIEILVKTGYIESSPVDPYGGVFYLTSSGGVQSTSKFALIQRP